MKKRAILSVFDKTGVVEFAKDLEKMGYEILSTGGTAKTLREAGISVTGVSEVTDFPECLDGRVKTLHPKIHGGILARRDCNEHMEQIESLGVKPIDVVAINLYPFRETIQKEGVSFEECIENIDIGGPTMLRAAAKNFKDVTVVTEPADYERVISEIKDGGVLDETKLYLAYKVFKLTSAYDTLIAGYLRESAGLSQFPETLTLTFNKFQEMRYGENPHMSAAFYNEPISALGTLPEAQKLHGKELSFNNINDTSGALELLKEFDEPCVVAVKHANPCGVGLGESISEAYERAYEADPVSIFGGIIAANREIDEATAQRINEIFIEIVIAPSYTPGAIEILTKKKNIRILKLDNISKKLGKNCLDLKRVAGGLLVQERDVELLSEQGVKCVTKRQPTEDEMHALMFAWRVVKHTKSNGIVLSNDKMTLGVGPGQTNRITALELAIKYAGERVAGAVMASDAFFPFSDCVEAAVAAGITAIVQPGGSIRDEDSIRKCDEHGIAMLFTGMRHFKH